MERLIKLGVAALGGLFLVTILFYWLPQRIALASPEVDMTAYYNAARAAIHHKNLYDAPVDTYGPDKFPSWYLYAPQFAVALEPLGMLTFKQYVLGWYLLIVVSFIGYAYNLARIMRPGAAPIDRLRHFLIWFFVLVCTPGELYALTLGNVDVFLCFLTSFAFLSPRSSLVFAAASQIKPFALFPLLLSSVRKRSIPWAALGCLIFGFAIGIAGCGFHSLVAWQENIRNIVGQGTFGWTNISISFAGLRLLRDLGVWHYLNGPLNAGPRLYLSLMGIAGPVAAALYLRRLPDSILYAAVLVSSVAFAPICWLNYISLSYILVAASFMSVRSRMENINGTPVASNLANSMRHL